MIKESHEYELISMYYSDLKANRSQVPLINHINEGLVVLDCISASDAAKKAFCVHPMLQADKDLIVNRHLKLDPEIMMLAMEYRSVANEYLSDKVGTGQKIRLSPLSEVNEMLIADKVQNYKDFITYHSETHDRRIQLNQYFNEWFEALGISRETYLKLCLNIERSKL